MSVLDDAFIEDVSRSAYGWPESLRFTLDKTRELIADGVKGDLVECGVGNGVHPAVMARACQDYAALRAGDPCPSCGETLGCQPETDGAPACHHHTRGGCGLWPDAEHARRNIRLFDSFQGIPHGHKDFDVEWSKHYGDGSGRLEPTGVAACSLADVQSNLERWGCDGSMFTFYAGWFEEVLPAVSGAWRAAYEDGRAEGIAFLRLDGDLYSSTLCCLAYLEPLVVPGGVIVADDWNLDGCARAVHEYFTGTGRADQEWHAITESGDAWTVKA